MIKESPGFYYTMAVLFGAVGVGMLFAAYWSFEAERMGHVIFSLSMSVFSAWFTAALCRRANVLRREVPIQPTETTRGK